jgi:hypothetical protein
MSARRWKVFTEGGDVRGVDVRGVDVRHLAPGDRDQRWSASHGMHESTSYVSAAVAVMHLAARLGWPAVELLAPGHVSRATLAADNAALRAELDDLRGRLSRTASRLADLERTSAALAYDATLAALRRGPVASVCTRCHEERARWCAGCGFCEATCCACPGDEGSAA